MFTVTGVALFAFRVVHTNPPGLVNMCRGAGAVSAAAARVCTSSPPEQSVLQVLSRGSVTQIEPDRVFVGDMSI